MACRNRAGRTLALPLVALGITCVDVRRDEAPLPDGSAWQVLVQQDEFGALETAVGPVRAPGPISFVGGANGQERSRTVLLAYSESAIQSVAPDRSDAELEASFRAGPPRLAAWCEPRLPPPLIALEWRQGAWLSTEAIPALTAPWLEDRCPSSRPELWFDLSECGAHWCPRELLERSRCQLDVGFLGCSLSPLVVGTLDEDRTLCALGVDGEAELGAEPNVPLETSLGTTCNVFVQRREELELSLRRWSFADPLPPIPPPPPRRLGEESSRRLTSLEPFGVASNLVVLPERVIVSVVPGILGGCFRRGAVDPGLVVFTRAGDELVDLRTATASPCLFELEPLNDGRGFLGAYVTGTSSLALARFDQEGREVARTEVELDLREVAVGGLVQRGREVFVSIRAPVPPDGQESALLRFDLETLAFDLERSHFWRSPFGTRESAISFVEIRTAGRFLIVHDDQTSGVYVIDPDDEFGFSIARGDRGGSKISDLAYDADRGRLVATGRDNSRTGFTSHAGTEPCYEAGLGGTCDWTILQFSGSDFIGLRLSPWPGRTDRMASFIGVQKGEQVATGLAVFDLTAEPHARYRPVVEEVSDLPVWTVRFDGSSWWALIPDRAEILRITP